MIVLIVFGIYSILNYVYAKNNYNYNMYKFLPLLTRQIYCVNFKNKTLKTQTLDYQSKDFLSFNVF